MGVKQFRGALFLQGTMMKTERGKVKSGEEETNSMRKWSVACLPRQTAPSSTERIPMFWLELRESRQLRRGFTQLPSLE